MWITRLQVLYTSQGFSCRYLQTTKYLQDPQLDERYMYNGIMIDTHMNNNNIRNTEEAVLGPQYYPKLLY